MAKGLKSGIRQGMRSESLHSKRAANLRPVANYAFDSKFHGLSLSLLLISKRNLWCFESLYRENNLDSHFREL